MLFFWFVFGFYFFFEQGLHSQQALVAGFLEGSIFQVVNILSLPRRAKKSFHTRDFAQSESASVSSQHKKTPAPKGAGLEI
jgi:hypothetical protein